MKSKHKKIIIILIAIILCIFITLLILHFQKNKDIKEIYEIYSEENVQNRLENISVKINEENTNFSNLLLETKDNKNVLGIIKINRLHYEGLVYEGIDLNTLSKGVGHFTNSAYVEGNVCLANHNTIGQWSKLYTLKNGDIITYTSFLRQKRI